MDATVYESTRSTVARAASALLLAVLLTAVGCTPSDTSGDAAINAPDARVDPVEQATDAVQVSDRWGVVSSLLDAAEERGDQGSFKTVEAAREAVSAAVVLPAVGKAGQAAIVLVDGMGLHVRYGEGLDFHAQPGVAWDLEGHLEVLLDIAKAVEQNGAVTYEKDAKGNLISSTERWSLPPSAFHMQTVAGRQTLVAEGGMSSNGEMVDPYLKFSHNGVNYHLIGRDMSLDDLLAVAEAMK